MAEIKTNLLDRLNFFGIRIWDFCVRSLSRDYSWFFLFKILVPHPIHCFRGFVNYKRFTQKIDRLSSQQIYGNISTDELMKSIDPDCSSLLVAMGFCQRPLLTEEQPHPCPSKRFSHDCYFVDHLDQRPEIPSACQVCDIKSVAEAAIRAGASFYIMTSAMDIARDIFIPALEHQRFHYVIMFVCPYSILPITLPLFICEIKFMIILYASGDCRNYGDFVRADMGMKEKRTIPTKENNQFIIDLLKKIYQNKIG